MTLTIYAINNVQTPLWCPTRNYPTTRGNITRYLPAYPRSSPRNPACIVGSAVGKSSKDRVITLSNPLTLPLQRHLGAARNVHEKDLGDRFGAVYLPYAFGHK